MIRVYKTTNRYGVGWSDPRGIFGGYSTKPPPTHKRLIEDTERGELTEYEHDYIHGASDRRTSLQSHEALQS